MDFFEGPRGVPARAGYIEVITGSMFSGKTEELMRRLRRARLAGLRVGIFKPSVDNRYGGNGMISHDERFIASTPVENARDILSLSVDADVVGIDEAQFFDTSIIETCNRLAENGARVVIAGLDMDFTGKPFGPIPSLLSIADYITKLHAICTRCGNLAIYSFRKSKEEQLVLPGDKDMYEPLCRNCFNNALKKQETEG